jgi:hypothetical protein
MKNAQQAVEDYLSRVEVTTIKVPLPREHSQRAGGPQALLKPLLERARVEIYLPDLPSASTTPSEAALCVDGPVNRRM